MRACLICVLTLSIPPVFVDADDDELGSVPFRLRDASDIVLPVTVGGRRSYRFLLDTGSSRSAVTDRVAEVQRLAADGRTVVMTPAGRVSRSLVTVAVEIGHTQATLQAMVLPAADLGRDLDGIIGSDLLATRAFTIDYVRRRVSFDARGGLDRGTSLPLTHGSNGFLVTLPVRARGHALRFIPDTGTASFVLFARAGQELPRITPLASSPLRTVTGIRVGRAVLLEQLDIGDIRVRDQVAMLMNGSTDNARFSDGLLPLHLFALVTLDGPGGLLTIVPRGRQGRSTPPHK
jgi:predicted aspartyl protease